MCSNFKHHCIMIGFETDQIIIMIGFITGHFIPIFPPPREWEWETLTRKPSILLEAFVELILLQYLCLIIRVWSCWLFHTPTGRMLKAMHDLLFSFKMLQKILFCKPLFYSEKSVTAVVNVSVSNRVKFCVDFLSIFHKIT